MNYYFSSASAQPRASINLLATCESIHACPPWLRVCSYARIGTQSLQGPAACTSYIPRANDSNRHSALSVNSQYHSLAHSLTYSIAHACMHGIAPYVLSQACLAAPSLTVCCSAGAHMRLSHGRLMQRAQLGRPPSACSVLSAVAYRHLAPLTSTQQCVACLAEYETRASRRGIS